MPGVRVSFWSPRNFEYRQLECPEPPLKTQSDLKAFTIFRRMSKNVSSCQVLSRIKGVLMLTERFEPVYVGGIEIKAHAKWFMVLSDHTWSLEVDNTGAGCIRVSDGSVVHQSVDRLTLEIILRYISVGECESFFEALMIETG